MTALSIALAFLGSLAFVAWRDWLRLKQPIPPHEELKAKVKELEDRIKTAEGFLRLKHGPEDAFGG